MLKTALKTPKTPVQQAGKAVSVGAAAQALHAVGQGVALGGEERLAGSDLQRPKTTLMGALPWWET